jgi:hypothetical protein
MNRLIIVLSVFSLVVLSSCALSKAPIEPTVVFTKLPPAGDGSSEALVSIEGRVTGGKPGQQIVIYASGGEWWVQPFATAPFTAIQPDATWKGRTHPGSSYAALLVEAGFHPSLRSGALPQKGGAVLAIATAKGLELGRTAAKALVFAGYEWQIRETAYEPGGSRNDYDPSNAWTDRNGLLHLRIAGTPGHWTSAEVTLSRSLGYGSYRFVIRDVSHLEPAAVFTMMTWDAEGPSRAMDIEISKWGETNTRNAQFVIQPYYIPANTIQFEAPAGPATFMMRWVPGQAAFKAFRGAVSRWESSAVGEHVFTSAVPAAGNETIHMNLYVFSNPNNPLRHGTEVIIESFEYLP